MLQTSRSYDPILALHLLTKSPKLGYEDEKQMKIAPRKRQRRGAPKEKKKEQEEEKEESDTDAESEEEESDSDDPMDL